MIELQIANERDEDIVIKLMLPEDEVVLERKLEDAGIYDEAYRIVTVTSCIGIIESLTKADTSIFMLNELAKRLKQLPVSELAALVKRCEADAALTFQKIFCFLDLAFAPETEKELVIRFPVSLRRMYYGKAHETGAWLGKTVDSAVADEYLEEINRYMFTLLPPETGVRGLAYYLTDAVLKKNVFAVYPELEIEDGEVYGCMRVWISRWTNQEEQMLLKDALMRILTFGWGRTLHYDGYQKGEERITISFSGVGAEITQFIPDAECIPAYKEPEEVFLLHIMPYGNLRGFDEEREELVRLPQSMWGINDLLERLNAAPDTELYIGFTGSSIKELEDLFWEWSDLGALKGSLAEWNQLALMISVMEETERRAFIAAAIQEESSLSLKELIALAMKKILSPVEKNPEREGVIACTFSIREKNLCETIVFPAEQLTKEAWKALLSASETAAIDCRVPALSEAIYEHLECFEDIQTLSRLLLELEQTGCIKNYKAVLETLFAPSLKDAISLTERIMLYDFYDGVCSAETMGQKVFEHLNKKELTAEEKESICFSEYGRRMLIRLGAVETSYGYLIPKHRNNDRGGIVY